MINEVIAVKPDVMITPDWVEGEGTLFAKAQKAGIFVIVNNATNFPDQMSSLGIAGATSEPQRPRAEVGHGLGQLPGRIGQKLGTIILGNPYPQNTNQQGVVVGAQAAIVAGNVAHKTKFVGVELADNSGTDEVGAIGLWKAKITQLGSSFVGGFAVADSTTQAAVKAYQQSRFHAGQYPLAAVDVTTASLSELQQGWVLCVVDAGFYMQGWLPVMLAFQQLERGLPCLWLDRLQRRGDHQVRRGFADQGQQYAGQAGSGIRCGADVNSPREAAPALPWPDGAAVSVSLTFDVDAESALMGLDLQETSNYSAFSERRFSVCSGIAAGPRLPRR